MLSDIRRLFLGNEARALLLMYLRKVAGRIQGYHFSVVGKMFSKVLNLSEHTYANQKLPSCTIIVRLICTQQSVFFFVLLPLYYHNLALYTLCPTLRCLCTTNGSGPRSLLSS